MKYLAKCTKEFRDRIWEEFPGTWIGAYYSELADTAIFHISIRDFYEYPYKVTLDKIEAERAKFSRSGNYKQLYNEKAYHVIVRVRRVISDIILRAFEENYNYSDYKYELEIDDEEIIRKYSLFSEYKNRTGKMNMSKAKLKLKLKLAFLE